MQRRDWQDVCGGALMIATGVFFALYGRHYDFGSAARMGPGFFPITLGWVLAGLGLLIALPALWRRGQPVLVLWGNWFWSVASLLAFALLLPRLGLFGTALLSALVALMPSLLGRVQRLLVATSVAALTTAIFALGLNMQLRVWPWTS